MRIGDRLNPPTLFNQPVFSYRLCLPFPKGGGGGLVLISGNLDPPSKNAEEMVSSILLLARTTGIFAEPAGVAALAGLIKMVREKRIGRKENVLVLT